MICRVPCKKIINLGDDNEQFKTAFDDYETYFKELDKKFEHLLINGEQKFRADGLGMTFQLPRNTKQEFINICDWKPLIKEKSLNESVFKSPSENDAKISDSIDKTRIIELENQLSELPIDECLLNNDSLLPVLLSYSNGIEYEDIFRKLYLHEKSLEDYLSKEGKYF